ncbi:Putative Developmental regulator medusa [Rhizopus microsporus]|nr:Putative Developmental regulator medusa [Rhizopus microsporus]
MTNYIEIFTTRGTKGIDVTVIIHAIIQKELKLAFNEFVLDTKQSHHLGVTSLVATVPPMPFINSRVAVHICFIEHGTIVDTRFIASFIYEQDTMNSSLIRAHSLKDYQPNLDLSGYVRDTTYPTLRSQPASATQSIPSMCLPYNDFSSDSAHSRITKASSCTDSISVAGYQSCHDLNRQIDLKIIGDINSVMYSWTAEERDMGRRLVQFWRQKEQTNITCVFKPVLTTQLDQPMTTIVSCIYWMERNDFFITSVDLIALIESLLGINFNVDEKNRVRRNLEGFRPVTIGKSKPESANFFKLIMSYPDPKPRNIERDLKVFSWRTLPFALQKIIAKYSTHSLTSKRLRHEQHNVSRLAGNIDLSKSGHEYIKGEHDKDDKRLKASLE